MIRYTTSLCLTTLMLLVLVSGCATSANTSSTITVEGDVRLWGNEPFTRYVLETNQATYYVLDLDDEQLAFFKQRQHGRYRLTGREYPGLWQDRRFTMIDVDRIDLL